MTKCKSPWTLNICVRKLSTSKLSSDWTLNGKCIQCHFQNTYNNCLCDNIINKFKQGEINLYRIYPLGSATEKLLTRNTKVRTNGVGLPCLLMLLNNCSTCGLNVGLCVKAEYLSSVLGYFSCSHELSMVFIFFWIWPNTTKLFRHSFWQTSLVSHFNVPLPRECRFYKTKSKPRTKPYYAFYQGGAMDCWLISHKTKSMKTAVASHNGY
jgi:hypothetical protein